MPSAAYIEDEFIRLSVASAQPLGVTSLSEGQIEVLICMLRTVIYSFKYVSMYVIFVMNALSKSE